VEGLAIVAVVITGLVAVGIVVYSMVKAYEIDRLRRKGIPVEHTAPAPNALSALSMLNGLKASREKIGRRPTWICETQDIAHLRG
jgi:hypothetical protein